MLSSRGVSTLAKKSSKYSLSPLYLNKARAGRTTRAGRGRSRLTGLAHSRGDWNAGERFWSLANVDRLVTIASDEMYPE
jgi:hypothetical protein